MVNGGSIGFRRTLDSPNRRDARTNLACGERFRRRSSLVVSTTCLGPWPERGSVFAGFTPTGIPDNPQADR